MIKRIRLHVAAAAACLSVAAFASEPRDISIPAGDLAPALESLAKESGLLLIFQSDDLRGVRTQGVSGKLSPEEAVAKLISGTSLTMKTDAVGAILISPAKRKTSRVESASDAGIRIAQAERVTAAAAPGAGEESGRAGVGPQEVVVTATRRAENIRDVPASITAITADEIDRRGLFNADDYLRGIAGVSQVDSAYGQSIVIRGIETSPFFQNFFSSTTTATYFGETPTTTTAGLLSGTNVDLKLVDIQRVEVLRGPQGTAFGSSSLGGAVRTIPMAPKLDGFEAKVAGGYSNTSASGGDNYQLQLIGNIPLVQDRLAIRAVGYQYQDDGFYRNRAGSDAAFQTAVVTRYGAQAFAVDRSEVGSYYVRGGRIAALWQASDDLRLTLSYLTQKNETDGMPLANSGTYDQTILQVAPEHFYRGQTGGQIDMDVDIFNPVLDYDLGWGNLIATYSHTKSRSLQSNPWGAIASDVPVSNQADSNHREDVGELRLTTRFDGAWNFLGGAYVEDVKDDGLADNRWYGDPATSPYGTNPSIGARLDIRSLEQKAVFGEVSWKPLEDLTLTGGVRAYDYTRVFIVDASGALYNGAAGIHERRDSDASGTTFRGNVSYKLQPDTLLYASWSQGFRLGQAQIGLPASTCDLNGDGVVDGTSIPLSATRNVNSDDVDSYELGVKAAFLDRRLTVDTAIFHMTWSGVPVQVRPGTGLCNQGYVANAGESASDGIELEATYALTNALGVAFGGSWIHARLTESVPALNARKGNRLAGSPAVNANLGLRYEFGLAGHDAFARADAIYVGSIYGDLAESARLKSDDYLKVDASIGLDLGNLDVSLFVRNLTNEDALTYRGTLTRASELFGYRLRPRTVGLNLAYSF